MYHTGSINIVLDAASAEARQRAERVAAMVHGEVTMQDAPDRLRLVVTDDRLSLHGPREMGLGGVSVDFTGLDLRPGNLSRKQPLGRAIGAKARTVIDATAGMGGDALLLACMGYEVLAIERSPIIAALLEDGLRRGEADERIMAALGGRLRMVHGDARQVLLAGEVKADVVYVDPMFPPKRRASALPKKEIQLLRLVVGDDPDAAQLMAAARQAATQRVVVKRPTHAPPLAEPSMSIEGKLVRYDVYVGSQ